MNFLLIDRENRQKKQTETSDCQQKWVVINARDTFTDKLNKYTEKIHNYLIGCVFIIYYTITEINTNIITIYTITDFSLFRLLTVCSRNTYTESKYYSQLLKVYK